MVAFKCSGVASSWLVIIIAEEFIELRELLVLLELWLLLCPDVMFEVGFAVVPLLDDCSCEFEIVDGFSVNSE